MNAQALLLYIFTWGFSIASLNTISNSLACSVCLTSKEEYNRGVLATSCIGSVFWVSFYLWFEHDVAVGPGLFYHLGEKDREELTDKYGHPLTPNRSPHTTLDRSAAVMTVVALVVLRFAKVSREKISPQNWIAVPLAMYGFVVAASWIGERENKRPPSIPRF